MNVKNIDLVHKAIYVTNEKGDQVIFVLQVSHIMHSDYDRYFLSW